MNIQQILDNPPDDYAYKILKPHKRTVNLNRLSFINFKYPLLFIIEFKKQQLNALHLLQIHNNQFYQFTNYFNRFRKNCTEICHVVGPNMFNFPNFYKRNFENKYDCLDQAIDAFFNSRFHFEFVNQVNDYQNPVTELTVPFARTLHKM